MVNNFVNYMDLIDIAKINLMKKFNLKMEEYEKTPTLELKQEIIKISFDRKQLYSFDISTIQRYL